jgi:hypothetical protein
MRTPMASLPNPDGKSVREKGAIQEQVMPPSQIGEVG